ncbi:hypothetical protein TeGR_g6285, partial [Tetraparma gracilis]
PPPFPRYGFILSPASASSNGGSRATQVSIPPSELARRSALEGKRAGKWVAMLKEHEAAAAADPALLGRAQSGLCAGDPELLKKRVRKGVPDIVRGRVWNLLGGVPGLMRANPDKYAILLEKSATFVPSRDIRETIMRDINRTFPKHAMFASAGPGQNSLRNVLVAYSLYDEEVGYCQGLGFIAALFLTYMPEEEAFWQIVSVMNRSPTNIRLLYIDGMPLAQKTLYVGDRLIKKFFPKLHKHLQRECCDISM